MKNKNFLSCVSAVSLVALSLVGCSDYDNGYTEKQIQFIQNFKDAFGEIDHTQDWNLAERGNVTVTTSSPSNIKIYAKTNGKYKIVGNYEDVSGTQTLGFDVVEGTTDIMVTDGYTAQHTASGGSAAFNSTRLILTENDNDNVDIGKTDKYLEIDEKTYSAWTEHLPEEQFNLSKVSEDFVYVSTGEFTIYPIYWNTSNFNELGVYYLDSNGSPIYVPIYKIKALRDGDTWTVGEVMNAEGKLESKVTHQDNDDAHQERKGTGEIQVWWSYSTDWQDASNGGTYPYYIGTDEKGKYKLNSGPKKIQAKGITVDIKPIGTVFGMYIKTKEGWLFHSNKARNTDAGASYDLDEDGNAYNITKNQSSIKAPHAGTFIDNGHLYLGFEDWTGNTSSDFDLNDCVFMFGDDMPEVLDDGADKWIISAEDLGNTYDIDYNDVVIEVEHVSGTRYAYVTPLAAGGTLASYVYFGDTPVGSDIIDSNGNNKTGEIHELFSSSYAATISGEYTPLNVGNQYTPSRRTYEIAVPRNFSLASNVPDYTPESEDETLPTGNQMGGFHIWVLQQGEEIPAKGLTEEKITALQNQGKIQKIENFKLTDEDKGDEDNVPYIICTPKYWLRPAVADDGTSITERGHYRWPKENVPMFSYNGFTNAAYDEQGKSTFAQWVANKTESTDWYKYPNVDVTLAPSGIGVNPEGDIFGGGNTGEEGGDTPGTGGGNGDPVTVLNGGAKSSVSYTWEIAVNDIKEVIRSSITDATNIILTFSAQEEEGAFNSWDFGNLWGAETGQIYGYQFADNVISADYAAAGKNFTLTLKYGDFKTFDRICLSMNNHDSAILTLNVKIQE